MREAVAKVSYHGSKLDPDSVSLREGERVLLISTSPDGFWASVELADGRRGLVAAGALLVQPGGGSRGSGSRGSRGSSDFADELDLSPSSRGPAAFAEDGLYSQGSSPLSHLPGDDIMTHPLTPWGHSPESTPTPVREVPRQRGPQLPLGRPKAGSIDANAFKAPAKKTALGGCLACCFRGLHLCFRYAGASAALGLVGCAVLHM
mmetsp:Transcript_6204/g.15214  ORF Transcript_6204/g.15214 Transcript_6204/m.15214 type:complete len:205 (-) Transcript_6204:235-849(-)